MVLVGGGEPAISPFILGCVWITTVLTLCQGIQNNHPAQYRYPFIKPASSFSPASSASDSHSPTPAAYDYIVIGGGTAGCPLAATLSRKYTVLLLERGGTPFANWNVSFMANFHLTLADTSETSASQMFISTDGVFNSRARILGGGTCINAGFYTRASASYIESAGWDSKLVNESFQWIEKQIVRLPELSPWQKVVRDSLIDAGISPFNGFTYDHIYGTKVGGTIFDRFGRRHTAAELLESSDPQNLQVLVYATVQRIEFDTIGGKLRAKGVVFKDEKGRIHRAVLSGNPESEIVVSAGAIGTPHLLLLSGIGPKEELKKFNIPIVLQNEFVGKEMTDNPLNTIFVPSKTPVEQSLIQTVGITKQGVYIESSSGYGQSRDSIRCHHGIASAEIGQISTVPPRLRTHAMIHEFKQRKRNLPYEAFQGGFVLEKIAYPLSKGGIRLKNRNIDDNPLVTFNYFSHPSDLAQCVEGIRVVEKMLATKHFSKYRNNESVQKLVNMSVEANINLIPKHTNDTKSLEQFCRDTVLTIWHYHGGCHVGQVVNSDYKVLGVKRLRIVDGSVFRESPGTNPQATVMMMGRYMGVKILRERLGRGASEGV